jgi:glycosyltransferase involved in cell wall biosynthesis
VHTNGYKANTLCAVAARRAKTVVVKTEHGLVETALRLNKSAMKSYFNRALDQLVTLALTNHVVYVTHDLAGRFRLIHRSKNRTVIHNAIAPIGSCRTGIADALERNRFNVGIVGRVDEVKGHMFLLRAVESLSDLSDLQVHVIGNGPLEARLREFCLTHCLEPKVRFWGFREDIHELMRGLDVLVMPSLHEGLPYTLLEAMYLRIPVIASAVGGLREILRDEVNALLVAPANHQELANAMRHLHDDSELRERLVRRAFADVTSRFMVADMAQKYVEVYGSVLDTARRS